MTEQPSAQTQAAWNTLRNVPYFGRQTPLPAPGGDFNEVLLLEDSVVRVPRDNRNGHAAVEYETEIFLHLQEAAATPPVSIPRLIEAQYGYGAPYTVSSRLFGPAFLQDEIRQFTNDEKIDLGRAVGSFVAWFAAALPMETCTALMAQTQVYVPDRARYMAQAADVALSADEIDYTLADILLESKRRLKAYSAAGLLKPTITGHDDLWPGNMIFTDNSDSRALSGIIDFGSTQPSTPERELRHIAGLGNVVCDAAVTQYEGLTGARLSAEFIDFWAVGQASTVLTNCLLSGHKRGEAAGRAAMQTLRPGYDWSRAFIRRWAP